MTNSRYPRRWVLASLIFTLTTATLHAEDSGHVATSDNCKAIVEKVRFARTKKTLKWGLRVLAISVLGGLVADRFGAGPDEVQAEELLKNQTLNTDIVWDAQEGDALGTLDINYEVSCRDDAKIKYLNAHVALSDGTIVRTHLFSRKTRASINVGALASGQAKYGKLYISANPDCEIKGVSAEPSRMLKKDIYAADGQVDWTRVARLFAPRIVVRADQYTNPNTDVLMEMNYAIKTEGSEKVIVYQGYFSDEDSKTDAEGVASQNGTWGRSLDIEHVTILRFDAGSGKCTSGCYQGFVHVDRDLPGVSKGEFPTVYNMANNNIFSDRQGAIKEGVQRTAGRVVRGSYDTQMQKQLEVAYYPQLTQEITYPMDRSEISLRPGNEWMYEISDDELRRENKLPAPSTQHLHVVLGGKLAAGKVYAEVNVGNEIFTSGGKAYAVKSLGKALWESQAVTAVPLSDAALQQVLDGKVTLDGGGAGIKLVQTKPSQKNELEVFRAYVLKKTAAGYKSEQVYGNFAN
ncbi:MAG TPA: hypothetical protein VM901_06910 [Bdellovibrionota bacterium]|jgi:hypothetical protein|nr:hypothetical protein [Bdellovibrionota bacterium]